MRQHTAIGATCFLSYPASRRSIILPGESVRGDKNVLILCLGLLVLSSFLREFKIWDGQNEGYRGAAFLSDPVASIAKTFTADDTEMFDSMANAISASRRINCPITPLGLQPIWRHGCCPACCFRTSLLK